MEAKEILLNKQNFAVIGVTTNQEKYGYKIYQRLKKLNKNVYGVSPIYNELNGETIYPNLSSIDNQIDVAVFVVNPKIALIYIEAVSYTHLDVYKRQHQHQSIILELLFLEFVRV